MHSSKYPPYGKRIGSATEIRIYMGPDAWKSARIRHSYVPDALVLPDGEAPSAYKWPVAGCDVLVFSDDDIDKIPELARILLESGALVVRVLCADQMVIYRPIRRAAA